MMLGDPGWQQKDVRVWASEGPPEGSRAHNMGSWIYRCWGSDDGLEWRECHGPGVSAKYTDKN